MICQSLRFEKESLGLYYICIKRSEALQPVSSDKCWKINWDKNQPCFYCKYPFPFDDRLDNLKACYSELELASMWA